MIKFMTGYCHRGISPTCQRQGEVLVDYPTLILIINFFSKFKKKIFFIPAYIIFQKKLKKNSKKIYYPTIDHFLFIHF